MDFGIFFIISFDYDVFIYVLVFIIVIKCFNYFNCCVDCDVYLCDVNDDGFYGCDAFIVISTVVSIVVTSTIAIYLIVIVWFFTFMIIFFVLIIIFDSVNFIVWILLFSNSFKNYSENILMYRINYVLYDICLKYL